MARLVETYDYVNELIVHPSTLIEHVNQLVPSTMQVLIRLIVK